MSLLEEQKAERRSRILAAARTLIAERGYEGLTMRDLARASRVSVPTLYNLFGGKHAILLGELEETIATVTAGFENAVGEGFAARAFGGIEAANDDLLAAPAYSRELVHLFLVSPETRSLRRETENRFVMMMADSLREAQTRGEIVRWVDPFAVARREYAHYVQAMIQWAKGDLDADEFRAVALYGMCLLLLGIARGATARTFERHARELQPLVADGRPTRAGKGG